MKQILSQILYEMEHGDDCAIVTVVQSAGSTPRGVGAKMLAGQRGLILGSVGGGAVEKEALELAKKGLKEKRTFLHEYILKPNPGEDIGMVCGGNVTLLFQYISSKSKEWENIIRTVLQNINSGVGGWLISPFDETPPVVVDGDGVIVYGDEWMENVNDVLSAQNPSVQGKYYIEPIPMGDRVIIFGAGHIAQQLVKLLPALDFKPVVYDDRQEFANDKLFPQAERIICAAYDDIAAEIAINDDDFVVIMTDGHSHDFTVQAQIMRGPYAYLGVIGSRHKTVAINKKLCALGISQEDLARVHTPIGTAIRAVTPAEIAISIAGELILVRAQLRTPVKESASCPMN